MHLGFKLNSLNQWPEIHILHPIAGNLKPSQTVETAYDSAFFNSINGSELDVQYRNVYM